MTNSELRHALIEMQLSQRAFASFCGVSAKSMSHYAVGRTPIPTMLEKLVILMQRYRVHPEDLDREIIG